MPKMYTAIRDKFIKQGYSEKDAKKHAAMIYNASHPGKPLIRYIQKHEGKGKGGGK